MGALRWNSGDTRAFSRGIERFSRVFQIQAGRAWTWGQPRAVSDVHLNPCTEQVPWAPPVIQARIEKGQSAGSRDDVSRETIVISFCFPETILHSNRKPRPSPLFFVILRSLRRRISARGGWVGLEAGRFFADSTTASVRTTVSVRQNDNVKRNDGGQPS